MMKSLMKKLQKKFNNRGSAIILVVVALSFIGILVGALLTAAKFAYRQKLYNYNSKDNFYYLEQAMDEIYAGVGSKTMTALKEAYSDTLNYIVYYDVDTRSYETRDSDEANKYFKSTFMKKLVDSSSGYFGNTATLADDIEDLISNESVTIDKESIGVSKYYIDDSGDEVKVTTETEAFLADKKISRIVITNIVLKRRVEYSRSSAKGTFTQTISTDIEISEPDFDVDFSNSNIASEIVYDYCVIAGNGVQIEQEPTDPLTINGNMYAAADHYNKTYLTDTNYNGSTFNLTYLDGSEEKTYTNVVDGTTLAANLADYDGKDEESKYSGLFVKGSKVSILSDMLVVPGTIAALDEADVAIYNSDDANKIIPTKIYCDNIFVGGESSSAKEAGTNKTVYSGSSLVLRSNAYVRDDLTLDSDGVYVSLVGSYIGYSNTSYSDTRIFTSYVDEDLYKDTKGKTKGHYNSSAVLINGRQDTLDLSSADNLYVAGRAYIEHSKIKNINKNTDGTDIVSYVYSKTVDDYKTGESISVRPSQLAYIPVWYDNVYIVDRNNNQEYDPEPTLNADGTVRYDADYFIVDMNSPMAGSDLIINNFGDTTLLGHHQNYDMVDIYKYDVEAETFGEKVDSVKNVVPIVIKKVKVGGIDKHYLYYDFDRGYTFLRLYVLNKLHPTEGVDAYLKNRGRASADELRTQFIMDYVSEFSDPLSEVSGIITDITNYGDYAGEIINYPTYIDGVGFADGHNINASGAMTKSDETSFQMIVNKDSFDPQLIKSVTSRIGVTTGDDNPDESYVVSSVTASRFNKDMIDAYNDAKYYLEEIDPVIQPLKHNIVDEFVAAYDESAITPINTYFNFENLNKDILIKLDTMFVLALDDANGSTVDSMIGHAGQVNVISDTFDNKNDGVMKGIILSKNPVQFSASVKSFEGLIVTGDKFFVKDTNSLTSISANRAMCKEIIKELIFSSDENAQDFLNLLEGGYKTIASSGESEDPDEVKNIDYLDYSSVVKYSNWMKDVTDEYGE